MKLTLLISSLLLSTFASAQKLSLVGSNFSFAKGNVDVEVLTEIIQQKQDEVKERVFRNLVIDNFRNSSGTEKSIATYLYIYDVLHTLTAEKNKTVITRQIVNNIFEYSLVYGFTREFVKSELSGQLRITQTGTAIGAVNLLQELETIPITQGNKVFLKDISNEEWRTFNILLDMAYDIFLKDETGTSLHNKGLFKMLMEKPTLKKWYEQDNSYLDVSNKPDVQALRTEMEKAYNKFKNETFGGTDLIAVYKELQNTDFKQETITETQYNSVKRILRFAITSLKTYSNNNLIGNISEFLLDYTLVEFAPENTQGGTGSQPNQQVSKRGILYIDAEGLIANLYDKFANNDRRSTVSRKWGIFIPTPFLIIGATHSGAFNSNNQLLVRDNNISNLNNIYFASEKIGLKFTFKDRKYTHSFEPGEEYKFRGKKTYWIRPQSEPLLSRWELYFYGSGLLYNIVDIKSQENFNYTLVGSALGVTFFNGLMLNIGAALPINAKSDLSKKYLYTLSFDIPIIDYITALSKKRNKI